jgi:tRNA A37 threonylcarbamoyladenosine modification protein TsaB
MAAAQAFALSRSLPLYPIVSHDAEGWGVSTDTVVVTDARRGEVAFSIYSPGAPLRRVRGPELATPEGLNEALGEAKTLLLLPEPRPLYLRAPDVTVKP